MKGPIDQFLDSVAATAGKEYDSVVLRESLDEMRNHLEESALGFVELGESQIEAEKLAVLSFGKVSLASEIVPNPPLVDRSIRRWIAPSLLTGVLAMVPTGLWISVQLGLAPPEFLRSELPGLIALLAGGYLLFVSAKYRRIALPQLCLGLGICWVTMSVYLSESAYVEPIRHQLVGKEAFTSAYKTYFVEYPKLEAAFSWNNETIRQFQNGTGESFLKSTKTAEGYAKPIGRLDAVAGTRQYSLDYEAVRSGWQKAADKLNLSERMRLHEWQRLNEAGGWVHGFQANRVYRSMWVLNSTKEFLAIFAFGTIATHLIGVCSGRLLRRRRRLRSVGSNKTDHNLSSG